MYQLFVEGHFDAAHRLRSYHGKCENLHGHRFKAVIRLEAAEVGETGLVYDFVQLKRQLREALARFDHACLNDVPPFDEINPSSEHLATTIYNELEKKLTGAPVSVSSVEVWESPQSCATYRPD